MVDKKHEFTVTTQAGQITFGTDDVKELLAQPYFNAFLGRGSGKPASRVIDDAEEDDVVDSAQVALLGEQIVKVRARISEIERKVNEIISAISDMREAVAPTVVQQPQPVSVVAPVQRSVNTAFLDTTPDKMTKDIWDRLTTEQKEMYAQKYMPQQQQQRR